MGEVLDAAALSLRASLTPGQARLDAETLLAQELGRPRVWLFAHPEGPVPAAEYERFVAAVSRRAAGEPLEYVTGSGEFYGLRLTLGPDVLVPRPETEVLVEAALDSLSGRQEPSVIDVGVGSGAIALAIAARHRAARVFAVDVSMAALTVARRNVATLGLIGRVLLFAGDLLVAVRGRLDLIVANLPYVADADLDGPSALVARFEPRLALAGGENGLAVVARLLSQAPACLAPGGTLLAEIGSAQGPEAARLAQVSFPTGDVDVLPDRSGRDRVLRVRAGR